MNLNPSIFKAYDIRGKYPLEINEEIVREIISSFISKLKTPRSRAPKENKFPTGQAKFKIQDCCCS